MEANQYLTKEDIKKFKGWTFAGLQHLVLIHSTLEFVNLENAFFEAAAKKLKKEKQIQFTFGDYLYDIFESSMEKGWVVNVYPNEDGIFDEDGQLIEDNQADGGFCTGSARSAVEFLIN